MSRTVRCVTDRKRALFVFFQQMFRLIALIALFMSPGAACMAQDELPQKIYTPYGTYLRVATGWKCEEVGRTPPRLLQELQVSDTVTAVDSVDLSDSTAIGMMQVLRTLEFDLARSVAVQRAGVRLLWTDADSRIDIVASQQTLRVLRSSTSEVRPGDVLEAIGAASFQRMLGTVDNPLTSVVTIEVKSGKPLLVLRNGKSLAVAMTRQAAIRLVNFDLDVHQEATKTTTLGGLARPDEEIGALRGRWVLLHFWATWCVPCMQHLPDVLELGKTPGLEVLSIGFADNERNLSEMQTRERGLKVFAPSAILQREIAVVSIPCDVLLGPDGKSRLVISGNMQGEQLKKTVLEYVEHERKTTN